MALTVTVKPAYEPVSVDEVRTHLRIDTNAEDAYILPLIKAARDSVENFTHRRLITQTVEWRLDCWMPVLEFPCTPVQSFSSIKYIYSNGTEQTLSTSKYQSDTYSEPPRVMPAYGETWPSLRTQAFNAVTVTAVVGYGTPVDVPKELRQATLMLIGHWYENRENIITGTIIGEIPMGVKYLMYPYKIKVFS